MNELEYARQLARLERRLRALETGLPRVNTSGWLDMIEETWTYASATTFTIAEDVTDRYQSGDAVRFKQGGAFLHGRIVDIAYSDPNTTVTISGDAIANDTITDNYYSKAFSPQGLSPQRWVFGNWSSTSWDGDAKTTGDNGIIDLSAAFALPAGIKAVSVMLSVRATGAGIKASLSKDAGSAGKYGVNTRTYVADMYCYGGGIVNCDANGDIYFAVEGSFGSISISINGYLI